MKKFFSRNNSYPHFIGIGAPKAATTWLIEALRTHPEIAIPAEKELVFFSVDKRYDEGTLWYEKKFSNISHKVCGEFSVSYLGASEKSAKRIFDFCPNVKIICILRNPVQRAWSYYKWLRQVKNYKHSFTYFMKNHKHSVNDGLYYKHLVNFKKYFNDNQILILNYDNIIIDPKREIQLVYKFLNVDAAFNSPHEKTIIGRTINPRFRSLEFIRNKIFQYLRKNEKLSRIIVLSKRYGLSNLYRIINNKDTNNYLDPADYNFALNFFIKDLNKLQKFVDFDISNWTKYLNYDD